MPKEEFEMKLKSPKDIAGGNFVGPDDIRGGKTVTITEAPNLVESQFVNVDGSKRMQYRIQISISGLKGDRLWTMNNTSYKKLYAAFGDNAKSWIGKKIRLDVVKVMVRGEVKDSVYGEPIP